MSGPTVGDAISNPDNVVAQLVDQVADNAQLVDKLFLRFLNRPGKPEEINGASVLFEQLEAEHAQLVADLNAYTAELASVGLRR